MHRSKTVPFVSRPRATIPVLLVFLAYLVYFPIHAFSVEHCLPGVNHVDGGGEFHLSDEEAATGHTGHAHHEHSDGSHHRQHHTAKDHEVETTGKIGGPAWMGPVLDGVSIRLLDPVESLVARAVDGEVRVPFFLPGHWLISRGPPFV